MKTDGQSLAIFIGFSMERNRLPVLRLMNLTRLERLAFACNNCSPATTNSDQPI